MKKLFIKHKLVVSSLGATVLSLRDRVSRLKYMRHPELSLLWEEDRMMRACVRKHLPADAICVDVGVHIGSITKLFQSVAPTSKHVMIEASPEKAGWLSKAFPDYTLHQVAVSDAVGEVSFFENLDHSGFSSLKNRAERGRTAETRVQCTTLDILLADAPRVDLVKIDVEGFEPDVIRGAQAVLKRLAPRIIFEAGPVDDPDVDDDSYMQLFRLLTEDLGYEVRPIFGWYFDRKAITDVEFSSLRTYPFAAFNFVAEPKGP